MKKVTVVGSGLVGLLWATYLGKAGYDVKVFEKRSDLRLTPISAGKSINLATSYRGWKALDEIGLGSEIRKIAIPMYGRTIHNLDGSISYQPYGKQGEAIYSVSRGEINAALMNFAEKESNKKIHFNEECVDVNLDSGITTFKNTKTGNITTEISDLIFATDGAFSAVRYLGMQKTDQFNFSQQYIEDGYKEIVLPAGKNGTNLLERETLHIWPRGRFMLIALPNFDGSFTCTLFMPFKDHDYCFENLKTKEDVNRFFKIVFPDFYQLMPHIADSWDLHPLSSLAIVRCFPWTFGKTALIGDAAHATVPFFGQGMNCGFEDCTTLWNLMKEKNHNWTAIFESYQFLRKPNCDSMQDLSLQNYVVMRDTVTEKSYELQQKIERRLSELYPNKYFPLYSMVSFTDIEYKRAWDLGNAQTAMIQNWINKHALQLNILEEELDKIIHQEFIYT